MPANKHARKLRSIGAQFSREPWDQRVVLNRDGTAKFMAPRLQKLSTQAGIVLGDLLKSAPEETVVDLLTQIPALKICQDDLDRSRCFVRVVCSVVEEEGVEWFCDRANASYELMQVGDFHILAAEVCGLIADRSEMTASELMAERLENASWHKGEEARLHEELSRLTRATSSPAHLARALGVTVETAEDDPKPMSDPQRHIWELLLSQEPHVGLTADQIEEKLARKNIQIGSGVLTKYHLPRLRQWGLKNEGTGYFIPAKVKARWNSAS